MGFEKELSELISRLPDAKARIIYLEKLLKKEKAKEKRKIIKKLLSNSKKELEKTKDGSEKKKVHLEEIVKPSAVPIETISTTPEEEYIRPITQTEPIAVREGLKEEMPKGEESYSAKEDYKSTLETQTAYLPEAKSEYLSKFEGEMLFKAKEETTPTDISKPLEDYTAMPESEEYKRKEEFKDLLTEASKREEEEKEYRRKKMRGEI